MRKQELLTKILTNRINVEKAKETTDFTEIKSTMDILVAGGSITSDQYGALEGLFEVTTATNAS